MAMFPVEALHGYSLPRSNSAPAVRVERKQSRGIKAIFRRPSAFSRRGSKAHTASRASSLIDGAIEEQQQSPLFAHLPLEVRLQIYEILIGDDTYHFRATKYLHHYRCPRQTLLNKSGREVTKECDIGHPGFERPMSIREARMLRDRPRDSKAAMLQTCKLAYAEMLDLLYRRTKFAFSAAEPMVMFGKIISTVAIERILVVELHAPDMLVWQYRVTHPRENRSGLGEWMDSLALLRKMTSLRSLYIIVPNAYANFSRTERKHDLEIEREFLGRFADLPPIPDFVVWMTWYDDNGQGYPHGDQEAKKYAFKLIRFSSAEKWPQPLLRDDEK